MGLGWYNGHSPQKRERVQAWLNEQWNTGALPRPTQCAACGQTDGAIHGHLEDYDQPTTYVPLCITCHLLLHCRYRNHRVWHEYRQRVAQGWQAPPLDQRTAFGVLKRTILAGNWPEGVLHATAPGETFLDTLSMTRTGPQSALF